MTRSGAREERPLVVVVGAGLSGLAAAWRLRQLGCQVAMVERRRVAGGRRRSERSDGFYLERVLDVVRTSDTDLVAWIRDSGAGDELLPLRPVLLAQAAPGGVHTIDASGVSRLRKIAGVQSHQALRVLRLPRLMRRYRHTLSTSHPERAEQWDFRSVADFARLYFGESVYQHWVGPLAAAATLGDTEDVSRVAFLLEWEREQRGRPAMARRGLSLALQMAAEKLDIALGMKAEELVPKEDGRILVRVAGSEGKLRERVADAVVITTSPGGALQLLSGLATAAERDFFAGVRMGPTVLLGVALERPISGIPQYVRVPRSLASPLAAMLIEPGGADTRAPQGYGVAAAVASASFAAACEGANDEVVEKEMIAALERIYPRAAIRFTRLARGAGEIPHFEVGAYRELARFRRVQRDLRGQGRRLYFAGDYLSGLGAVNTFESGVRAANEVASDLSA